VGTEAIGLVPTFEQIWFDYGVHFARFADDLGPFLERPIRLRHHLCRRPRLDERRGCTSWLQTSPTLGIVLSPLIVIIAARTYFRR
jgi:hypothetical protein